MEEKDGWLYVTVTKWVWDKANLHRILSTLKEQGVVHFRDRGYFNIDWDFVIEHSRNKEVCFFCRTLMVPNKKTKDHLIPSMVLKAYGISNLPNNKVPCCFDCNQEKAYLMPDIFRRSVRLKLHETGDRRYEEILITLNRLIYYGTNEDIGGGKEVH